MPSFGNNNSMVSTLLIKYYMGHLRFQDICMVLRAVLAYVYGGR